MLTKLAQWYLDKNNRAPRGTGFSIDHGIPDRGKRYGGAGTIHNTGTIDIVMSEEGDVAEVWFRCTQLAANVSVRSPEHFRINEYQIDGKQIVAVELV